MPSLSNDVDRAQLLNLDPTDEARGPWIIVQTGYDPKDDTLREGMFLLRRDGQWVDIAYYFTNPPHVLDEAVYETTAEAGALLRDMSGRPHVATVEITEEALAAWIAGCAQPKPGLPGLRQWVVDYRGRHARHG